jgi:Sep15/SelM redox domain
LNRLPDLKSFLKGGEAESYRGVQIKYVRGQHSTLHVFRDGWPVDSVVLSSLRSKEKMHQIMIEHGFEKKSQEELQADLERARRQREAQNFAVFHRQEYVRLQHLHVHLFRQHVMQDYLYYQTSWIANENEWLHKNYDAIFRGLARTSLQLHGYAIRYLESRK